MTEAFAEFSEEPLASASVAQVHAAKLVSGEEVVVKVVRPGIDRTIRKDLALMHTLAQGTGGHQRRRTPVAPQRGGERLRSDHHG